MRKTRWLTLLFVLSMIWLAVLIGTYSPRRDEVFTISGCDFNDTDNAISVVDDSVVWKSVVWKSKDDPVAISDRHWGDLTDYLVKEWLKDTARWGATDSLVRPNLMKDVRGWKVLAATFRDVIVTKTIDTNDYVISFYDTEGNSVDLWLKGRSLSSISFWPNDRVDHKFVNHDKACQRFFEMNK